MATNFSTLGGTVTKGETFSKLIYHIDEARDMCSTLGHLHQTEDTDKDRLRAQGWRAIEELLHRMRSQIIQLAKGTIQ